MNVAVPAASFTVTSLIEKTGVASSSVIVAVPVATALLVMPLLRVAGSVKSSTASSSRSFVIGVRTSTLTVPAAIVALVPAAHVRPASVEISMPMP